MAGPLGHPDNPAPRRAARVLVVDADQRVLLLRGVDPADAEHAYWFTVGGGIDAGETPQQAAARELREEIGLDVAADAIGAPVWRDVTQFSFDGYWYRQEQDFFLVRVDGLEVSFAGHDPIERASIAGFRWWSRTDLVATTEAYYPPDLPAVLRETLGT